jgi:hypothetical protein
MMVTARSTPIRPDVLIDSQGLHTGEPVRVSGTRSGFHLDRIPAGVPGDTQMPGQRRDGGVVKAKCIDRPPHRPYRQHHPGRRLLVSLTERVGRTRRFSAAPDPHQPSQQGDPAEAGHIMQHPGAATVADRDHPARRAGRLQLTRLESQHQPRLTPAGPSDVSRLVAADPEGPDLLTP